MEGEIRNAVKVLIQQNPTWHQFVEASQESCRDTTFLRWDGISPLLISRKVINLLNHLAKKITTLWLLLVVPKINLPSWREETTRHAIHVTAQILHIIGKYLDKKERL